jgi:cell division protein FtsN
MAHRERENPDDVRVFDGGDDEEEGGSHLPVVIVISLLVLAAFGGVVWLAYNNGVARGRADVPATLAAVSSEQPAVAPGSGAIGPKQIKIYQQQAGSEEDTDQQAATAPPAQLNTPPPALRSHPDETKPAVQPPPAAPPVKSVAAPPVKPAAAPPVKSVAAPPVKSAAETPVKQPVATPVKSVASPAAGGAYLLQIGSFTSQSDADAAWKTFRGKHASLLAGFGPNVQKADLGDKGVWYRLRVGSFADKDAAAALCDRLKAEGAACFPAK